MRKKLILIAAPIVFISSTLVWYSNDLDSNKEETVVETAQDAQRLIQVTGNKISDAPNFSAIENVQEKKTAFFEYLKPGVARENERIVKERGRLEQIKSRFSINELTSEDHAYAERLSGLYHIELSSEGINERWIESMLRRVDVLPEALVLTQAAKESGWGTSRFATEANNYFGQWCYSAGCGVVPQHRKEGMTHEVAKFRSVQESIHRYFMNVNRNRAYQELREIRYDLHINNQDLLNSEAAIELANGLIRYSERGQPYVDEIQGMIRFNQPFWSK
ncbi:glucosaminidase domain-containing protein [uncultured Vibrio sp.]|uniref:glucosaminidase domain-containing protein n=1 Tax=uncultured Vibrio sp. TaxID=114054 RepID=UPI0009185FA9|nr:glucosaminidase domain-containing protein [uncultured Vibrio sp.]OIQ26344.1 MAG: glucosaminidase [Vibrio sp. MedPE-SWchi]